MRKFGKERERSPRRREEELKREDRRREEESREEEKELKRAIVGFGGTSFFVR